MARWLAVFWMMCYPLGALAQEVVAGLSRDEVKITANFDGSDILIYGAVKRDAPASKELMDVIITVSGPDTPVTVRKKDRRFGIWVNTAAVVVDQAPSFYAVASTARLADILSETEDLRRRISIGRAIRSVDTQPGDMRASDFTDALIRIREKGNLYQKLDEGIRFFDQTLFSTTVDLPANLIEGPYLIRIFLVRHGQVLDSHETTLMVNKVGLERWIYDLAHHRPLGYGLLSLFIAIAAGWMASAVFKYVRF